MNNKPFKPPRVVSADSKLSSVSSPPNFVSRKRCYSLSSSCLSSPITISSSRSSPIGENGNCNDISGIHKNDIQYYAVLYRKFTSKKNKSWDGDGFLCIRIIQSDSHNFHLTLKNENYEVLANGTKKRFNFDSIVSLGNFEIESDYEITDGKQLLDVSKNFANSSNPAKFHLIAGDSSEMKKSKIAKKNIKQKDDTETEIPEGLNGDNANSIYLARNRVLSKPFKCVMKPVVTNNDLAGEIMKRPDITESEKAHKPLFPINEHSIVMDRIPNAVVDVVIDPSLSRHMRAHQCEGVKFLYNCVMGSTILNDEGLKSKGGLLADDMGLGKTLTSIALIWMLIKQSPFRDCMVAGKQEEEKSAYRNGLFHKRSSNFGMLKKVLIIVPLTLITNWQAEFKKWLGMNYFQVVSVTADSPSNIATTFMHSRVHTIMVIGYERLVSIFSNDSSFKNIKFDMVVCDEAHRMKNDNAKIVKVLKKLEIEKVILLTGTPVQNDSKEFFTLCDIANPGVFGKYSDFVKGNGITRTQMVEISKKFILRRTKEILLKVLPARHDLVLFIRPLKNQVELFESIGQYIKKGFNGNEYVSKSSEYEEDISRFSLMKKDTLSLINIYKKICNSPRLLQQDNLFQKMTASNAREAYNKYIAKDSGKLNFLSEFLANLKANTGERVVIVSNYTQTLDIIERLIGYKYSFCRLDGAVTSQKRMKLVNEFNKNGNIFIFLLSSKSGGAGLNLIGASRLILFDSDWNPAIDIQAMGRIHRDGQTKQCFIYRLITTGCIDEKIYQRQLVKIALSKSILDGAESNGKSDARDSNNVQEMFSEQELKDLFTVDTETQCNTYDLISSKMDDGDFVDADSDFGGIHAKKKWITASQYKDIQRIDEIKRNNEKRQRIREMLESFCHLDPNKADDFGKIPDDILKKTSKNRISFIFSKG